MPEVLQDLRKRDNKARTFAPSDDDDEMKKLAEITKAKLKLDRLKTPDVSIKPTEKPFDKVKRPKDFEKERILKNINKYEDINLNDVNNLIDEIKRNIAEHNNIVDLGNNKEIYFRDLNNFLYDIKDGKISDFNKEREYKKRLINTENKLKNTMEYNSNIRRYKKYLNDLKKKLFTDKKSSGKSLTISYLPIFLSKIYTNNSSKELINNIKQLVKNLYDNKQITKQVYNILNKALRYKELIK